MATSKNKILRKIIHDLLDNCDRDDLEYFQGAIDVKLSNTEGVDKE